MLRPCSKAVPIFPFSSCTASDPNNLNIDDDPDDTVSVYVFVSGGRLSSRDTGQVVILSRTNVVFLPCTPSFDRVVVRVSSGGRDVTDKFLYNSKKGFTSLSPLPHRSFTCYFTFGDQTESLHLSRGGMDRENDNDVTVTFGPGETVVVAQDTAHVSCRTSSDIQVGT